MPEPKPCCRVRNSTNLWPRTPAIGSDTALRLSEVPWRFLDVHATSNLEYPFVERNQAHRVKDWAVALHSSMRRSTPCGIGWEHREDTSHRPMQPTHETSNRRSFNSWVCSFRWLYRGLRWRRFSIAMRCWITLRWSEPQVDARLTTRSNFGQITHSATSKGRAEHRTGRCCLAAAFSTACEAVWFDLWRFTSCSGGSSCLPAPKH